MVLRILALAFLMSFVMPSGGEAKWNPFDPDRSLDNQSEKEMVSEHQEEDKGSEEIAEAVEDNHA